MKITNNLGDLLLAIFLILYALSAFGLSFSFLNIILALLALVAGVLKLVGK
jgi:hypothetical protein